MTTVRTVYSPVHETVDAVTGARVTVRYDVALFALPNAESINAAKALAAANPEAKPASLSKRLQREMQAQVRCSCFSPVYFARACYRRGNVCVRLGPVASIFMFVWVVKGMCVLICGIRVCV